MIDSVINYSHIIPDHIICFFLRIFFSFYFIFRNVISNQCINNCFSSEKKGYAVFFDSNHDMNNRVYKLTKQPVSMILDDMIVGRIDMVRVYAVGSVVLIPTTPAMTKGPNFERPQPGQELYYFNE